MSKLEQELEKLEEKYEKLNLITSHTKRTSLENGRKITKVHNIVEKFSKDFAILNLKLTGDDGYINKTKQNTKDIELHNIKLSKNETRQIKIIVFAITAGLIMGWLISQYRIEDKRTSVLFYHRIDKHEIKKI